MHQALYRKWRPTSFGEVCGQDAITSVLAREVADGKILHAYLFCGSRGTGKTTCAKILAKAVNCLAPENGDPCGKCEACVAADSGTATDIIEMDAASNTGVDYIRDIREAVSFFPAMLKYKVYIIDEVHMLSESAFNALLKTLEEPPAHIIFILATTEVHKILPTVLSRCQRFDFLRIPAGVIAERLTYISEKEDIKLSPDAAFLIGKLADGGMRDAISMLELLSGGGAEITVDTVRACSGVAGVDAVASVADAVARRDTAAMLATVEDMYSRSTDLSVFWQDLFEYYRNMLLVSVSGKLPGYIEYTSAEKEILEHSVSLYTVEKLNFCISVLTDVTDRLSRGMISQKTAVETGLIKMSDERYSSSAEALSSRIAALEAAIASGSSANTEKSTEKKPEKAAPAAEKKPSVKKPAGEKPVLREFDDWAELVNGVSESDRALASMLKKCNSKFSSSEKKIYIYTTDPVSENLLSRDTSRKTVISALLTLDPAYAGYSVEIRKAAKSREENPLDGLI